MLRQWNEVEAKFASDYSLTTADLFAMTWRRFRVLFGGAFEWKEKEEYEEPPRISSMVDWDSAKHTPVKDFGSLGIPVSRIPVGGSD